MKPGKLASQTRRATQQRAEEGAEIVSLGDGEVARTRHICFMSDTDPLDQTTSQPRNGGTPRTMGALGNGARTLVRQTFALLGLFLIVIGVPLAIMTPFPFVPIGLPVVIFGVMLLGRNSIWGRNWMEGIIRRYPQVERYAPNWLMQVVFAREKRPEFRKSTEAE